MAVIRVGIRRQCKAAAMRTPTHLCGLGLHLGLLLLLLAALLRGRVIAALRGRGLR